MHALHYIIVLQVPLTDEVASYEFINYLGGFPAHRWEEYHITVSSTLTSWQQSGTHYWPVMIL